MRRILVPLGCLALVVLAVTGFRPAADVAYYSMKLPAGVTVADLIRDGYDIGHGHGSRPTVLG